jgi:hypothetical protein
MTSLWHRFLEWIGYRVPSWVLVQEASDPYWHHMKDADGTGPYLRNTGKLFGRTLTHLTSCGKWVRLGANMSDPNKKVCPKCSPELDAFVKLRQDMLKAMEDAFKVIYWTPKP